MPGRLQQARSRADALVLRRMTQLAERVANGARVSEAGVALGLSKGETARAWANIKAGLGAQAK